MFSTFGTFKCYIRVQGMLSQRIKHNCVVSVGSALRQFEFVCCVLAIQICKFLAMSRVVFIWQWIRQMANLLENVSRQQCFFTLRAVRLPTFLDRKEVSALFCAMFQKRVQLREFWEHLHSIFWAQFSVQANLFKECINVVISNRISYYKLITFQG